MQRILEANRVAYRLSVNVDRELLGDSSPETEPRRSKRKRGRRKGRAKRRRKSSSAESWSAESDDEMDRRAAKKQPFRERSIDTKGQMGGRQKDEMRGNRASESEETGRSEGLQSHRKRRRRKGGNGSGSESGEDSGEERQEGRKGTVSESLKRTLADAGGIYLQTDRFSFRWSLVSVPSFCRAFGGYCRFWHVGAPFPAFFVQPRFAFFVCVYPGLCRGPFQMCSPFMNCYFSGLWEIDK